MGPPGGPWFHTTFGSPGWAVSRMFSSRPGPFGQAHPVMQENPLPSTAADPDQDQDPPAKTPGQCAPCVPGGGYGENAGEFSFMWSLWTRRGKARGGGLLEFLGFSQRLGVGGWVVKHARVERDPGAHPTQNSLLSFDAKPLRLTCPEPAIPYIKCPTKSPAPGVRGIGVPPRPGVRMVNVS